MKAKIAHMGDVGGYRHIYKELFDEFINQLSKLDPINPAYAADLQF